MIQTRIWRRLIVLAGALLLPAITAVPVLAAQHTVLSGETLSGIATNYGVPVDTLAQQNAITDVNVIYAGQELTIPASTRHAAGGNMPYTVALGDTLSGIADAHGIRIADLLTVNKAISDPNHIYVGQVIAVPGAGGGSSSSTVVQSVQSVSSTRVRQLLDTDAANHGLDPLLVEALAWQESGWQQGVVSSAGAVGVMQIVPATGTWIATDIVGQPLDVRGSVADNILAGTAYLQWLVNRGATTQLALAGYYQGPTSVQKSGVQPGTQLYINDVLAIRSYIAQHGVPPQN